MDRTAHSLRNMPQVDLRALYVECPQHKGVTLPVVGLRIGRSKGAEGSRLYLEAACRHCQKSHYVRVIGGLRPPISQSWNE